MGAWQQKCSVAHCSILHNNAHSQQSEHETKICEGSVRCNYWAHVTSRYHGKLPLVPTLPTSINRLKNFCLSRGISGPFTHTVKGVWWTKQLWLSCIFFGHWCNSHG